MAVGSAATNFLLNGLFYELLSIIASLGIILHMFLVTLNYPVEMMDFFGLLFPLITFDIFPVSGVYEKLFHFAEITTDHPLTDQFNTIGYISVFGINNIGSLFIMVVLQLNLPIIMGTLRRYKPFKGMKMV